jgi:hypothetical protein
MAVSLMLVAFTAEAVHTAARRTDRDRAELKGPVKAVSTKWQSNHKDEYGDVDDRELGTTTYDAGGNLVLDRQYTGDFVKEKRPERRGPNVTVFHSIMGNSIEHYRFDRAGNMIELQEWYGDKATGPADIIERMKYDAAGLVIERDSFDSDRKPFGVTVYERDAKGNVMLEEDHPPDRQAPYPRMHYTYTFDPHGNWTERLVTRENVAEDDYFYRYAGNLFRTLTYF